MSGKMRAITQKLGKAPGSLIYTGEPKTSPVRFRAWEYDASGVESLKIDLKKLPSAPKKGTLWIQVEGIHDTEIIKKIGKHFEIDPLLLEDICNVERSTNTEALGDFWAVHVRHLFFQEEILKSSSVSLVAQEGLILSFTESEEHPELLTPIENRLTDEQNPMRQKNAYYLAYTIVDLVVDHYMLLFSKLHDDLNHLDEAVFENTHPSQLDDWHRLRKDLLRVRKPVVQLIKVMDTLPQKLDTKTYKLLRAYFQDTNDHLHGLQESLKNNLEKLSGLFDLYFSLVSLQMNRTMQFLALITVIFLPLTLLTGIYGMNFRYMPGLENPEGFKGVMIFMAIMALFTLWYARRKKWF